MIVIALFNFTNFKSNLVTIEKLKLRRCIEASTSLTTLGTFGNRIILMKESLSSSCNCHLWKNMLKVWIDQQWFFNFKGMQTLDTMKKVYDIVYPVNPNICFLQCTSAYPVEPKDVNLKVIKVNCCEILAHNSKVIRPKWIVNCSKNIRSIFMVLHIVGIHFWQIKLKW